MIRCYELVERKITQNVTTAMLWHCALCGDCISGMGGPNYHYICSKCGDEITQGKRLDAPA
jgi:hypothetical protein